LGFRSSVGAVASADFAGDRGGSHGVVGSPGGGIDGGVGQEGEQGVLLDQQVLDQFAVLVVRMGPFAQQCPISSHEWWTRYPMTSDHLDGWSRQSRNGGLPALSSFASPRGVRQGFVDSVHPSALRPVHRNTSTHGPEELE
jgi:hypothetical protein